MAEHKIEQATTTNINSTKYADTAANSSDFNLTVNAAQEAVYEYDPAWLKWKGFYDIIPELQASIDKKAIWTVGKGYKTDEKTKKILKKIRGNGKDTFNSIMYNLVRTFTICGDAFAEIIRKKTFLGIGKGELINLKPISPGTMRIIANDKGIITGYEQRTSTGPNIKFKPEQIFHLSWNRLADAPHGISAIEKLKEIMEARLEATKDLRLVFHRYVKPLIISTVDTDDETEIRNYKAKLDRAISLGENLIIPEGTVKNFERVSIPQYSTLDPLPWIKTLQEYFIISEGVPKLILGHSSDTTEASGKIVYLSFQQMVEFNQLFLEENCEAQLDIIIEYNFPADLMEAQSTGVAGVVGDITPTSPASFKKDGNKKAAQPADMKP